MPTVGQFLNRWREDTVAPNLAPLTYATYESHVNDVPSLIFTGRYGTAIDPRTLNRKFVARCEAAGVRPITVYDARHTCATLLVDLDVHPRVIMRILRHADQAVTMEIYANASSAATQEAAAAWRDPVLRSLLYFAAVPRA